MSRIMLGDLPGHAVIEASAGTGKTFTIENLVVDLIEANVDLEKILVVTFTEKATGELRQRVRAMIGERLAGLAAGSIEHTRLRDARDRFDAAAISTIHGFCHGVLKQYAFENGQLFDLDLVDDPLLWERLFHEQLRTVWPAEFFPKMDAPLRVQFAENRYYQDTIIAVASRMMPDDELRPDRSTAAPRADEVAAVVALLSELLGPIPDDVEQSDLYQAYFDKLDLGKSGDLPGIRKTPQLRRMLRELLSLVRDFRANSESADSAGLLRRVAQWYALTSYAPVEKKGSEKSFRRLVPPRFETDASVRETCPRLPEICAALDRLIPLFDRPECGFIAESVRRLVDAADAYKRERGLIDYNDMLVRVRDALAANPALLGALRARYRVALLDEFQDTDPVQWEIFRTIFAGDDAHRLIVVGDPKQAIYGFRGANVETYLDATRTLVEEQGAARKPLEENWRSTPELIEAYNTLFEKGDWFADTGIAYAPVAAPTDNPRARVYRDESLRRPLTVVDVDNAASTASHAREIFARFAAREIRRLLDEARIEIAADDGDGARALRADDIAVLVSRRGGVAPLERALREAGVPYAFHKQEGLFQSDEALHLLCLLRAIAHPDDARALRKALLTTFFDVPLDALARCDDLPADHPIKALFGQWQDLCERRDWPALFRSILGDTGVLVREMAGADGERRVTDYEHMTRILEEEAIAQGMDALGMVERLAEYWADASRGRDVNLYPMETERPKVQILTMHTSKGLEFPIVFVAGGFTEAPNRSSYAKYTTARNAVYDLAKGADAAATEREQREAEKRRLFYVALTRAQYKLYVPKLARRGRMKEAPLVGGFVYDALERAWGPGGDDNAQVLAVDASGKPLNPLEKAECRQVARRAGHAQTAAVEERIIPPEPLLPEPAHGLRDRVVGVESFTSLEPRRTTPLSAGPAPVAEDAPDERDDDEVRVAPEDDPATRLPAGKATGAMIHEVMERIDFAEVAAARDGDDLLARHPETACRVIHETLARHGLPTVGDAGDSREAAVAGMIHRTLHTPLAALGASLAQTTDRLVELSFHYPFPQVGAKRTAAPREGFMTGAIDLVCRRNGRIFLVDWKSNASPGGDYGPAWIDEVMAEHKYHLQYRLYTVAVCRWLAQRACGFDYERDFGGAYYLFLRGMNGRDESAGVFFRREDWQDVQLYEAHLCDLLNDVRRRPGP